MAETATITPVPTTPTPTTTTEAKPQPVVKPAEPKVEAPKVTTAEILNRQPGPKLEAPIEKETNYREDLEKITDPAVKAIAEKALKDFETGYNKKYEALAIQRKNLESLQSKYATWTPQRLAEELRKPDFVQAIQLAQQAAPPSNFTGNQDDWSALSTQEQERMRQAELKTQNLEAQMARILQSQEDAEIKKIQPDYEPQLVDEAIEGIRAGQISVSRLDIWKVVNHDKNVEKGYQFGYEDGFKKALERLNGSTNPGNPKVTSAEEVPDEVRKGGFSSIALWRLKRARGQAPANKG